jgi:hypothetical protein
MSVLFADCCSLTKEKENSVLVVVTLTGALVCRKLSEKTHFLSLVQEQLIDTKPSIIILFVD